MFLQHRTLNFLILLCLRISAVATVQIALYEGHTPQIKNASLVLSEEELYDLALAHIAEGYARRWPHHVYKYVPHYF